MVWYGKEGWVGARGLARPGPEGGRIEDASARPPHPEMDCPAEVVGHCVLGVDA